MENKFDLLKPRIYEIFDICVKDVDSQAILFRQQEIISALNTFSEWAQSIPLGGTKDKLFRDEARDVRSELKSIQKWDHHYFYSKNFNFVTRLEYLVAESNGAIAAIWHCYDECDHHNYDGKFYLIRDSWATRGY